MIMVVPRKGGGIVVSSFKKQQKNNHPRTKVCDYFLLNLFWTTRIILDGFFSNSIILDF